MSRSTAPRNLAPRPARRLAAARGLLAAAVGLAFLPAATGRAQPTPRANPGAATAAQAGAPQASAPQATVAAVDPFYAQLLQRGVYAYQQGDMEEAAGTLRLAVFGLLDDPPRLTYGLAYLALAQRGAGDGEALQDTLGRLISISDRFDSYSAAALPAAVDEQLSALMVAQVPEATLLASKTFRRLGDEKFLARVSGLPTAERRAALSERADAAPREARWPRALAELELAENRPGPAAGWAERALAAEPDDLTARCLHGRALAAGGDCADAVAELTVCPASRSDETTAVALLDCLADLGRWRDAQQRVAELAPAVRAARPVARLQRRIDKQVARLPEPQEAAAETAELNPDDGAVSNPEASDGAAPDGVASDGEAAETELPAAARADLEEARRRLAGAERQRDLAEPLRLAGGVADAHPESREAQHLAGEIAYRASRWADAVRYFRRGGVPRRADLRFYMAVSLFESGDRPAAAEVLREALPELPSSPFIRSYAERILGPDAR